MKKEKSIEIDIWRLLQALWSRKFLILLVAVLCAAVVFVYSNMFIAPKYQADVLIYVNNTSLTIGNTAVSIASGELTAARQLLNTYLVLLKSRTTLDKIIEKANLPYSRSQLKGMISAGSVNETEVFSVVVTSSDPNEARTIADTIAEVLPTVLTKTIKGSSVEVVDYAVLPKGKSSPNVMKNSAYGFLVGLLVMCAVFVIMELANDKIHTENTLTQMFEDIPVLAIVPHDGVSGSGKSSRYGYGHGYGYGYGEKKSSK